MEYTMIIKSKIIKFRKPPTMLSEEFFWKIRYIVTHNKNPNKPFINYKCGLQQFY